VGPGSFMSISFINRIKASSLDKKKKLSVMEVPMQLFIETVNICNANCIFCAYQFDTRKKVTMSNEMFEKIVKEYCVMGGEGLNLTSYAGEAFVDRNILTKIGIADRLGFKEISMYSNLTLTHKFDLDELLHSGLTKLTISTAPLRKDLYEKIYRTCHYNQVLKNMEELLKRFTTSETKKLKHIDISFRADRDLDACVELDDFQVIEPYLGNGVSVSCMSTFDGWMDMIKQDDLLDGMVLKSPDFRKPVPCDRLYMLQITSDGGMRVCGCRYNYAKVTDDFYVGNIADTSLSEAYNSNIVIELKKSFYLDDLGDSCKRCSWYENHRYKKGVFES